MESTPQRRATAARVRSNQIVLRRPATSGGVLRERDPMRRKKSLSAWNLGAVCAAFLVITFASAPARAGDDTIKRPGDHPAYDVEIEPHGLLDWWDGVYGTAGF